jgi:hypothetical protein
MIGKERECWRELCEQAADEYDPQKLHELVVDNRLLEERERQLLQQRISGTDYAG